MIHRTCHIAKEHAHKIKDYSSRSPSISMAKAPIEEYCTKDNSKHNSSKVRPCVPQLLRAGIEYFSHYFSISTLIFYKRFFCLDEFMRVLTRIIYRRVYENSVRIIREFLSALRFLTPNFYLLTPNSLQLLSPNSK